MKTRILVILTACALLVGIIGFSAHFHGSGQQSQQCKLCEHAVHWALHRQNLAAVHTQHDCGSIALINHSSIIHLLVSPLDARAPPPS